MNGQVSLLINDDCTYELSGLVLIASGIFTIKSVWNIATYIYTA